MSRLIDRILAHGLSVATPQSLTGPIATDDIERAIRSELAQRHADVQPPDAVVRELVARAHANPPAIGPEFNTTTLVGLPVIAGDDVARYTRSLGEPLDVTNQVSSMAPPFDRFWLEFIGVPDPTGTGIRAWGWLVEASEADDDSRYFLDGEPLTASGVRWQLTLTLFLERSKNRPVGPVVKMFVGLAEDGTLYRTEDGKAWWAGRLCLADGQLTSHDDGSGPDVSWAASASWMHLAFPALLTISFLHCRNVETHLEAPPAKLSEKNKRRHGLPLVRYLVLDVEPMRIILASAGGTDGPGLRKALHLHRGHFKVFSEDAPLFGRHTGTWWWAPQVRGNAAEGVVVKDYRVLAGRNVGKAWTDAPLVAPAAQSTSSPHDPDAWGEGWAEHNRTVNSLAAAIVDAGLEPLCSARDEPNYDLAFVAGGALYVCEVKSLTTANEERQLRHGLGQVLRYRQQLVGAGHEAATPVLVPSRPPTDPSWVIAIEQLDGVLVVSPADWNDRLIKRALRERT